MYSSTPVIIDYCAAVWHRAGYNIHIYSREKKIELTRGERTSPILAITADLIHNNHAVKIVCESHVYLDRKKQRQFCKAYVVVSKELQRHLGIKSQDSLDPLTLGYTTSLEIYPHVMRTLEPARQYREAVQADKSTCHLALRSVVRDRTISAIRQL